jgi:hypothetical protein
MSPQDLQWWRRSKGRTNAALHFAQPCLSLSGTRTGASDDARTCRSCVDDEGNTARGGKDGVAEISSAVGGTSGGSQDVVLSI